MNDKDTVVVPRVLLVDLREYIHRLPNDLAARITRLAAAPSTSVREERLRYQAEFLIDRLSEFEGSFVEPSEAASEFYGHVAPAIARLEAALVPSTDEGKRHG